MVIVNSIKFKNFKNLSATFFYLWVPLGVLKMEYHRYPPGGVDYIFDQGNDQILKNICSIFICLEDKLNIPGVFMYYTKHKNYNNMFKILYNLNNTLFVTNYNSYKNIIIENNLIFLEYSTILQYLHANTTNHLKRKR